MTCARPWSVCAQLVKNLDKSKTEKSQKEAIKTFFVDAGFQHLSANGDFKLGNAVSNTTLRQPRAPQNENGQQIQWPDLYDINVE